MNIFLQNKIFLLAQNQIWEKTNPFKENDLTTDKNNIYEQLVRIKPSVRLWGVTNSICEKIKDLK